MTRHNLTEPELRTVRAAIAYAKKAADIIYRRGNGRLTANGVSEAAYNASAAMRSYVESDY